MELKAVLRIFGELKTAATRKFAGNVDRWANEWINEGPQDLIRQIIVNPILVTERIFGSGAAETGVLCAEIGSRVLTKVAGFSKSQRAAYLRGMENVFNCLANSWDTYRVIPDRNDLVEKLKDRIGNNEAAEVFQKAVKCDAEILLPRLGQGKPFKCESGALISGRICGVVTSPVVVEPDVIFCRDKIDTANKLIGVVKGHKTNQLVVIATELTPAAIYVARKRLKCEIYGVNSPTIWLDPEGGYLRNSANAVSFDARGIVIHKGPNPRNSSQLICMDTGYAPNDPIWIGMDRAHRSYRQSLAAGIISREGIHRALDNVENYVKLLPLAQKEGAEAALKVITSNQVSFEGIPISTARAILNNASSPTKKLSAKLEESSRIHVMGPGGATPSATTGAKNGGDGSKAKRVLDVWLKGTAQVGEKIIMVATIRLLGSRLLSGEIQKPIDVDPSAGPVTFHVQAQGFELSTNNDVSVELPVDADSNSVPFIFKVLEANDRWIELSLYQNNNYLTQVTIKRFVLEEDQRRQGLTRSDEVDLTIEIGADRIIRVYSPRSKDNLSGVNMGEFKLPARKLLEKLQKQIEQLYSKTSPFEVERELKLKGSQLAACLPGDLHSLLFRTKSRSVLIRHPRELEFPFELAFFQDRQKSFFLNEAFVVSRWLMDIENALTQERKEVQKAAVLQGRVDAAKSDHEVLKGLCSSAEAYGDYAKVRTSVFQTADHHLIHFIGHCVYGKKDDIYLELETGRIRLCDIGGLIDEKVFGSASPVVVLNGCRTTIAGSSLVEKETFASRFLENNAMVFVGTLWPVEEGIAHEFSQLFYRKLSEEQSVGDAVWKAREELSAAQVGSDGNTVTDEQKVWRKITLRSYCVFAHPKTQVVFKKVA